ncbi:MAG: ribonuclease III [Symbiobacteriia bacterium]
MQGDSLTHMLHRLAELTGAEPQDQGLYAEALTHPSWANEAGSGANNQRLEFLGDAVLQLVISDHIFRRYPERAEGELTRLRAAAVRERALAQAAQALDLGACLRLGRGEEAGGGRQRPSILADAFEAIIGAFYLDLGLAAAQRLAVGCLEPVLAAEAGLGEGKDAKTNLQERVQRTPGAVLTYELLESTGPDHDKRFRVAVNWQGKRLGEGEGRSKKEAEQQAAAAALQVLEACSRTIV